MALKSLQLNAALIPKKELEVIARLFSLRTQSRPMKERIVGMLPHSLARRRRKSQGLKTKKPPL